MQLTHLDVDYQREEQAKTRARLEELKKPKVIPREKPPTNFFFKPTTFDLPPSIPSVRPEKFQFLEKGKNRNFDYKIVISVKNP